MQVDDRVFEDHQEAFAHFATTLPPSGMEDEETIINDINAEGGEELQDWGELNKRFNSLNIADESIPKRSEKDFDIDHTGFQNRALTETRDQMFKALDHVRGHHEKQRLVGVWMNAERMAILPHAKGNFFRDMGKPCFFPNKRKLLGCWLLPIETVYLVERGSLILYLPDTSFEAYLKSSEQNFEYSNLKQISLSHLYGLVFAPHPELHDRYQVYALLKRLGYLILPFETGQWSDLDPIRRPENPRSILTSLYESFASIGFWARSRKAQFSIYSLHFMGYTKVFELLQYIPHRCVLGPTKPSSGDFSLHFNVWKPTSKFSKKAAPQPDYQVCVANILDKEFPSFADIARLWEQACSSVIPDKPATSEDRKPVKKSKVGQMSKKEIRSEKAAERMKKMNLKALTQQKYLRLRDKKLKQGSSGRKVVIAAIDNGIINFSILCETDFHLHSDIFNKDLNALRPLFKHGTYQEETKL